MTIRGALGVGRTIPMLLVHDSLVPYRNGCYLRVIRRPSITFLSKYVLLTAGPDSSLLIYSVNAGSTSLRTVRQVKRSLIAFSYIFYNSSQT
jgi:hypothetical protein